VNENQRRGVPKEIIENKKDEIYGMAQNIAKERSKVGFLFHRIAEKEGIRADQSELSARVAVLAQANQMAPQKFAQEMEKRGSLPEVYQGIIHEKVLNFLHEHAKLEDVPAGGGTAAKA